MKYLVEFASTHDYEVGDCRDGYVEIIVEFDTKKPSSYIVNVGKKMLIASGRSLEDWHWVGFRPLITPP